MKITHWFLAGTIFLMGASTISLASAGETGWYIGGGFGHSDDKGLDDTDDAFKFHGGYRFNKHFAVEGAFIDLGEFTPGDLRKDGLAIGVVGMLPLGKRAELLGKVGAFFWEVRVPGVDVDCDDFFGGTFCIITDERVLADGTDPAFGVGVQYHFNDHWDGRIERERFTEVGDDDVDVTSLTVVYNF